MVLALIYHEKSFRMHRGFLLGNHSLFTAVPPPPSPFLGRGAGDCAIATDAEYVDCRQSEFSLRFLLLLISNTKRSLTYWQLCSHLCRFALYDVR
jgi:hypothetical protein